MKIEHSEKNLLMQIANGFRASRGIRKNLDGEALVELANQIVESKLPQVIDRTITEITAEDLAEITEIGGYGFACCFNLKSVTIPDNVTRIGDDAFYACTSLKNVYYNGDIASWCNIIFVSAMSNPASYARKLYIKKPGMNEYELLTNLVIPDSVTEIEDYAFYNCYSLTSIMIPNTITSIGRSAFASCIELTSVTIPNSVRSIGIDAFSGCDSLTSLTIGNGVTSIGNSAFNRCGELRSVIISNSVEEIGGYAFSGCSNLRSITIGNSVKSIKSYALCIGSSANKATITLLGTKPPSIATDTFVEGFLKKIIVPKGCGEAYKTATNWANFADFIEEAAE